MEENQKQAPEAKSQVKKGGIGSLFDSLKDPNNRWLVIGVGVGALIITLIILFLTGVVGGKVAATVNGEKIYESQVNKEYEAYVASYKMQNKKAPDSKMEKEVKKLILERLIQQALITQAAEKEGVKISKKELDQRIDQIVKSSGKEQLDKMLKQMNWSMDDLRNTIENQLLSTKVREKVTKGIKVTNKDAEKYYKENKKNYLVPDTVSVKIATFKKSSEADAFIEAADGGNKFDDAAKKKIKGGVTAQQLSKDQITGIYGKELADKVFGLGVGQMTSAVKTKNGVYVAKVEKKEEGRQKSYKEVKEEIKSMLSSQKQMEKFNTYIQDLRKKAKITIYIKELKTTSNLPTGHP